MNGHYRVINLAGVVIFRACLLILALRVARRHDAEVWYGTRRVYP